MTMFHVTWEIDVDADSHQEAAAEAHRLVRKSDTTATVYDVIKQDDAEIVRVDLIEQPAAAPSAIVCHIRTSAGARFSMHKDEESLRDELVDYFNEVLAEGDFQLADDAELEEVIDAIEESEDVSWEEVLLP